MQNKVTNGHKATSEFTTIAEIYINKRKYTYIKGIKKYINEMRIVTASLFTECSLNVRKKSRHKFKSGPNLPPWKSKLPFLGASPLGIA